MDETDAQCWTRLLHGEGEAIGIVYDRHAARVARHASRLVSNLSDVDDVVAVVFLTAWKNRDRVRFVDGDLLPWLLVTATNVSRNVERSVRRNRALIARLPPSSLAEHEPDEEDAQIALRSLSIRDQQILTLRVILELGERQAAQLLSITPGTAKSRLHHAKARLARRLGRPTGASSITEGA